jgi:hypothetical protein
MNPNVQECADPQKWNPRAIPSDTHDEIIKSNQILSHLMLAPEQLLS